MSEQTATTTHEFETTEPVRLRVEAGSGEIRIQASDTDRTTVDIQPATADTEAAYELIARTLVEQRGDQVVVEVPRRGVGFLRRSPALPVVWLALFLFGLVLPPLIIAMNTLLQTRTPQRLMGRVSTAAELVLGGPQTLSIAVGAVLVTVLDYRLIFTVMAAVTLLSAAYLAATLGTGRPAAVELNEDDITEPPSLPSERLPHA